MQKGICVDSSQTTVLEKGRSYYLFPNGEGSVYVSRFPNPHAHMGCFQSKLFEIQKEEEWPQEPIANPIFLDETTIYRALLIWRTKGYQSSQLKHYYIQPKNTFCYFYEDPELETFRGCFPLHWFTDFKEFDLETEIELIQIEAEKVEEFPIIENGSVKNQYEQLTLF